ncbi:MAG TPA: cytochrome c oxidase subunit II [Caulobacteraceae bacterium]
MNRLAWGVGLTTPMSYLRTYGPRADPVTGLTWGLTILSLAVIAIITGLVLAGVLLRGRRASAAALAAPAERGASGLAWISIGLGLTVVTLVGALIWTMQALAMVDSPLTPPHLTLEITSHQWWWEARYPGGPGQSFATANEIHIPVGQPVMLKLAAADVIHSFWVPSLTGKTDMIPGRVNIAWLQADRPGVYRGTCGEYCGVQHAHMALFVIAQPPADFEAWRRAQTQPAAGGLAPDAGQGAAVFAARCASCHTVRGSPAHGADGPDLTHLMSRTTLAAGALPNTIGALMGWIANPQALKPGARMPATYLSGPQLAQLRAYLETLR